MPDTYWDTSEVTTVVFNHRSRIARGSTAPPYILPSVPKVTGFEDTILATIDKKEEQEQSYEPCWWAE